MQAELFKATEVVRGSAIFLGQQLDLKHYRQVEPLATSPLTIATAENGVAVLFRYGVVVLFGLQSAEITKFIADARKLLTEAFNQPQTEAFEVFVDTSAPEGPEDDRICLHEFNLHSLQTVADVLAKSIVLSHYELKSDQSF